MGKAYQKNYLNRRLSIAIMGLKFFNITSISMPHARQNMLEAVKLSVIRQKGETQNGCFKKTKYAKFSEKFTCVYEGVRHTQRACAYQGIRNVSFLENLTCFVFLKHQFWDSPFCLTTDEMLFMTKDLSKNIMKSHGYVTNT